MAKTRLISSQGKRRTPLLSLSDVRHCPPRGLTQIDDTKPYTLVSQIRCLVALLPRREKCDRYVQCYFERYNSYVCLGCFGADHFISHIDILYEPDFVTSYDAFWRDNADVSKLSRVDLRHLALVLIVISFGVLLEFDPKATEERRKILEDLRLAGHDERKVHAMLRDLEANSLGLQDREELSLKWSCGARKALSEASSFYGESIDTVRAGAMVSAPPASSARFPPRSFTRLPFASSLWLSSQTSPRPPSLTLRFVRPLRSLP